MKLRSHKSAHFRCVLEFSRGCVNLWMVNEVSVDSVDCNAGTGCQRSMSGTKQLRGKECPGMRVHKLRGRVCMFQTAHVYTT